jgi:enamine deaminase RidA (YjgF/YER057c/UK114 family)
MSTAHFDTTLDQCSRIGLIVIRHSISYHDGVEREQLEWSNERMNTRQNIASGTIWEERVGYSRAVRVGNLVFVSGTTATDDDGNVVGPNDPEAQARAILRKIGAALEEAGSSLRDVVRYRCYVTNADDWQKVGVALHEAFADVRPASTLVEVSRLIGSGYLVEIDVDAVIGGA